MKLSFVLDMIPVLMAIFILFRFTKVKVPTSETILIVILSSLFILCQTTWILSYMKGFETVTSFIDILWTAFNAGVMLLMSVIISKQAKGK